MPTSEQAGWITYQAEDAEFDVGDACAVVRAGPLPPSVAIVAPNGAALVVRGDGRVFFDVVDERKTQTRDGRQCYDEGATTGSTINEAVVQMMMDESIKALTSIQDVGEAWKSISPGLPRIVLSVSRLIV